MMDTLHNEELPCSKIQFSGGEPTLRKDFFEIVRMAKQKGFKQIQVATSSQKFAENPNYARLMANVRLSAVYGFFIG